MQYSDYIIYVDESGDHSLDSIDDDYPVFVLAFCIFHKEEYAKVIVPSLKQFKFDFFGHDGLILHEREIRKQTGIFSSLHSESLRNKFHDNMNVFIRDINMKVVACGIIKKKLCERYSSPDNPYNLALGLCLERASTYLYYKNQSDKLTHIIVESRGKREDKELELEFLRIIQQERISDKRLKYNLKGAQFSIQFVSKQANMAGKQIADLIARPIGRFLINPSQPNRAMDLIKRKFFVDKNGDYRDAGLKIFP